MRSDYVLHRNRGHREHRADTDPYEEEQDQYASQRKPGRSQRQNRKRGNGPNTPFGQGATPIVEVLHLIRDHKWPIQATIEFEYPVPPGSDVLTEIGKCVEYCKQALA